MPPKMEPPAPANAPPSDEPGSDDDVEIPHEEGCCPACQQKFGDQDKDRWHNTGTLSNNQQKTCKT